MSIATVMTKHPLTIGLDQTLADVKMLFDSQKRSVNFFDAFIDFPKTFFVHLTLL